MPKFLAFTLYGPMQAWGSPLGGKTRPTDDHPTLSGIIGLLGACLGITRDRREEMIALKDSLNIACRMDSDSGRLRDWHTVRVRVPGKKDSTITSERFYLTNAAFTVCLWKKTDDSLSLKEIANRIQHPVFTPSLGRKACVMGLPPAPEIIEADNLNDALSKRTLDPSLKPILSTDDTRVYSTTQDDSIGTIVSDQRFDDMGQSKGRVFSVRTEYVGSVTMPQIKEEECSSAN